MEVRIYDANLDLQGIIENQTSLLWNRQYFEPGDFELHCPITENNVKLLKRGNLVTMYGQDEAGVIEDIQMNEDPEDNEITASGRFLAAYMGYRIVKGTVNINSTIEVAMRDLLSNVTEIPRVELGTLKGFAETITGQVTYKNLLTYVQKLARAGNLGYRFRPDFNAKKIIFEIYQGVDRSQEQTSNSRVVFSEAYDNLNEVTYRINDQTFANVAYVLGEYTDGTQVIREVGDTTATGLDRREIFVDATGVDSEDITEAEYLAALDQEGWNELNSNALSETFECDTNATGNFVYRENYDLGDIVTVKKISWGMQDSLRITGLQETYEDGGLTVTPTLGDPLPTAMEWED